MNYAVKNLSNKEGARSNRLDLSTTKIIDGMVYIMRHNLEIYGMGISTFGVITKSQRLAHRLNKITKYYPDAKYKDFSDGEVLFKIKQKDIKSVSDLLKVN